MYKDIIFWLSLLCALIALIPFGKAVERDLMNNILKREREQEAHEHSERAKGSD